MKTPTCFLCKWIAEDLEKHGRMTGWPVDSMDKGIFPVDGKLVHVLLELDADLPEDPEDVDDLASVVLHELEVKAASN
jgi:hypothetical protein